jgi:hypothetical protein
MMETKAVKTQCEALKPDGTRCLAAALPDSGFCFFHDPSRAAERQEAQAQGGKQNRLKALGAAAPDVRIENSSDLMALLSETINEVRKGQLDPRIANSVGYLANITIKVFEQHQLEARIHQLEELLNSRSEVS